MIQRTTSSLAMSINLSGETVIVNRFETADSSLMTAPSHDTFCNTLYNKRLRCKPTEGLNSSTFEAG